eukprot:30632-Pelagococcus_subviridis.AAC.4
MRRRRRRPLGLTTMRRARAAARTRLEATSRSRGRTAREHPASAFRAPSRAPGVGCSRAIEESCWYRAS